MYYDKYTFNTMKLWPLQHALFLYERQNSSPTHLRFDYQYVEFDFNHFLPSPQLDVKAIMLIYTLWASPVLIYSTFIFEMIIHIWRLDLHGFILFYSKKLISWVIILHLRNWKMYPTITYSRHTSHSLWHKTKVNSNQPMKQIMITNMCEFMSSIVKQK